MRAGWNSENIVSTQAGINLEKVGVKAITLHPRTTFKCIKESKLGFNKRIKRKC